MKGKYFITRINNEIYSTDSIFWHSFFTDTPLPGVEIQKDKNIQVEWDIVTFNGEIIHRFRSGK